MTTDHAARRLADALLTSGMFEGPTAPPMAGLTIADAIFAGFGELTLALQGLADSVGELAIAVDRLGEADHAERAT